MKLFNKYDKEIDVITEFKTTFKEYLILADQDHPSEEDAIKEISLREKLNNLTGEASNYVQKAEISTVMLHTPPPELGGIARNVSIFLNLFDLDKFTISPQTVIDILDQAIGNYIYYRKEFKRKLINPLCWIGELIRIPFYLISFAGFDVNKIEFSLLGKLYKLFSPIIFFLAALVAILSYCDIHLSDIFSFFRSPPTRE